MDSNPRSRSSVLSFLATGSTFIVLSLVLYLFYMLTPPQIEVTGRVAERTAPPDATSSPSYRLIGWNDLGMHCMNESFADLAVLPPFNTLWAQLIIEGASPQVITSGVTIEFNIIDNTYSAGKTDFWEYALALFGANLPANVGLTGSTLSGTMHAAENYFKIEGVPLTPYRDSAPTTWYPYQQAHMVARENGTGQILAETTTVAPVSTEMRCDTCHSDGMQEGIATGKIETNILTLHDQEEGTHLMNSRPVLCAICHGSNALGLPGDPELPNLSRAMHHRHAPEGGGDDQPTTGPTPVYPSSPAEGTDNCYLCHPGAQTQCLRDTMYAKGLTCTTCHGGTAQVANPGRRPWIDLPRCGTCHEAQYAENPGTLYRNSTGHGGLYCEACHGSPHAILPTNQPNDNLQNIALQGHAGPLEDCTVCHDPVPVGPGPHGILAEFMLPTACTFKPGGGEITAQDIQIYTDMWRSFTSEPCYDLDKDHRVTIRDLTYAVNLLGESCGP